MNEPEQFNIRAEWRGDVADYDHFKRELQIKFPGTESLRTSSYKEGRVTGATNPEELLAAAQSSCMLLTFLAVCSRSQVQVEEYIDDAEALLEFVDRRYRVTKITLRPRVKIKGAIDKEKLDILFSKAHSNCYIAQSVKAEVVIEPTYLSA